MGQETVHAAVLLEASVSPSPWTEGIFRDCLTAGYDCWVLPGDPLVGFLVIAFGSDQAPLLNLAIHPQHQHQRLGTRLLGFALECARRQGIARVYLEVRPSNHKARQLYRSAGFDFLSCRPAYYRGADTEDALVLSLALDSSPPGLLSGSANGVHG